MSDSSGRKIDRAMWERGYSLGWKAWAAGAASADIKRESVKWDASLAQGCAQGFEDRRASSGRRASVSLDFKAWVPEYWKAYAVAARSGGFPQAVPRAATMTGSR